MKKFSISVLAMAFGVLLASSSAHAQAVFNNPGQMPTLTVSSHPCTMGQINGCWQTSDTASPGDSIGVHIYYENTSNVPAEETTLGMNPRTTGTVSSVTFRGGVASVSGPRAVGSATVRLNDNATVTFERACWYPTPQSGCQTVSANALFGSSGYNIGTVMPGQQGVLVAQFRVGDGDGEDNDCRIDSFTADDYSIDEGDSTDLDWRTTGCDRVKILPEVGSVSLDGSEEVEPNNTTTYTLYAYDDNGDLSDTDTVRIVVDEDNNGNSCSIDEFSANDYSIDEGDSTRLEWRTTGAEDVDITPGYSNRSDDGTVLVRPSRTTTYRLEVNCDNGSNKTRSLTITVGGESDDESAPQAITTVATLFSSSTAQLNGIAVPHANVSTTAWFEWGSTTSLGSKTATQTVSTTNTSTYYNASISGLRSNAVYYYRSVVQNRNGVAYGDIVPFQTRSTTVTPPTIVRTEVVRNVVVAQSAPSLLELRVDSAYDRMCIGGEIDYTVTYRNISEQTLQNAVLQINHQKEVTFVSASRGNYDLTDRTVTVELGTIAPGETGTVIVHGKINNSAVNGNLTVMTATVVYTNPSTKAQENAIAYSLTTVSSDCPNVLGASAFGFGSFLPDTLLEWLLLILVIMALVVLARQLYRKREVKTTY